MDSFYTKKELSEIGLKKYGENVLISRKSSFYGAENISIGDNVRIDDFCILSGHIQLGNYIHIAAYVALFAGDKGIHINDFSGISGRVSIYASNDDYSGETMTNPTIPEKYKNITNKQVKIGKHSIIGTGSVILPGVEIKEGSVVGALSLVASDTDEWSINAGVPSKKIKLRSHNLLLLEKQFLESSDSHGKK